MSLQDLANQLYLRDPSHKFQELDHELPIVRDEYMQKAINRAKELAKSDFLGLNQSDIEVLLCMIKEQEERL